MPIFRENDAYIFRRSLILIWCDENSEAISYQLTGLFA